MSETNSLDVAIDRILRGEPVSDATNRDELQVARVLASAVSALQPASAARERVRHAVRERVAARPRVWSRLALLTMSAPRLRVAVLAAVLLVGMLVGSAYALPVLLPQIFSMFDPSAVELLQSGRARELNISDSAAGVTITVNRAYADVHRIVVQFTVENPPSDPGQPWDNGQQAKSPLTTGGSVTLTDDAGRKYGHLRAAESPLSSGAAWSGEPLVGVYNFDATRIPANAERVSFHLTIAELHGVPDAAGVITRLPGPWIFTFTLPVSR
ncbi:MAG TPA: DUF4179 domain-containing protein [Candidatus Limnocylindria bacterium]|nr:DUF4179 domain-containing protein [Candidatus Limnocylindria bacterium]